MLTITTILQGFAAGTCTVSDDDEVRHIVLRKRLPEHYTATMTDNNAAASVKPIPTDALKRLTDIDGISPALAKQALSALTKAG